MILKIMNENEKTWEYFSDVYQFNVNKTDYLICSNGMLLHHSHFEYDNKINEFVIKHLKLDKKPDLLFDEFFSSFYSNPSEYDIGKYVKIINIKKAGTWKEKDKIYRIVVDKDSINFVLNETDGKTIERI